MKRKTAYLGLFAAVAIIFGYVESLVPVFTGIPGISLAGAALSLTVMDLLKKHSGFSLIGISVAGGVTHNIGQLIVAMIVVSNTSLMVYAPALLVAGVLAGILIGWLTKEVVGRLPLNL